MKSFLGLLIPFAVSAGFVGTTVFFPILLFGGNQNKVIRVWLGRGIDSCDFVFGIAFGVTDPVAFPVGFWVIPLVNGNPDGFRPIGFLRWLVFTLQMQTSFVCI
ncbi:hypothetical protein MLD38_012263 [Melastoma candidum]|uniref:Uncharacterized protein n=1 Tax=Melastoma candidum TaxID=119954 RepID=A0ACB9R5S8_9MYRT|nr:hypothetical protein MLD38_012263 [Melastoma candidum]